MKRKYGAALKRETLAEKRMRERAKEMKDSRYNFGSKNRMGAPTRGKRRSRAVKPGYAR
ncbi:MAG: hypothetical protein JO035_05575 [Betaproteobacteria bacterium]|nr:hypothetical protein [Betaproteobacteria bacterium]